MYIQPCDDTRSTPHNYTIKPAVIVSVNPFKKQTGEEMNKWHFHEKYEHKGRGLLSHAKILFVYSVHNVFYCRAIRSWLGCAKLRCFADRVHDRAFFPR